MLARSCSDSSSSLIATAFMNGCDEDYFSSHTRGRDRARPGLTVRFRPTGNYYEVKIRDDLTVEEIIGDVCRQAGMHLKENCYLFLKSRELDQKATILDAGLLPSANIQDNGTRSSPKMYRAT